MQNSVHPPNKSSISRVVATLQHHNRLWCYYTIAFGKSCALKSLTCLGSMKAYFSSVVVGLLNVRTTWL
jgi:hypothetical protein